MDKEQQNKKGKKNDYFELALFLILGFLLGIVIKTEAAKRITIGFNDYLINLNQSVYHLNDLQKKLVEEQKQKPVKQEGQADKEPAKDNEE